MAKIKSMIGCEFSTKEIRAVEVTKNNDAYQILAMGYVPLEKGVIEEGFIRDAERFQSAFSELMSSGGFNSNNVAIGINNENVMMRYAAFPKVDRDKLRNMVLLQAQEFIPIPINEMEVDYVIADETTNEDNVAQYNIMLVAARRLMLEGYINHLSTMRYTVNDIDSSLLALCREIHGSNSEEKYCLVNFTDDILSFIVIKGDKILMVRSITIPDRNRDAITELFGLNERAEDEENPNEREELIKNAKNFILSETSSTVSYYSMQSQEQIEKIYVISHSEYNDEILKELQENMPIPVETPQMCTHIQSADSEVLNNYASCIGVAISALEG
ncbi:MAG: pilus assembly protein PilM [Oscillospiraceae bacterium]|nr:pilus assembly protein PilM [Oscillospiraceae bacterium]